MSENSPSHSFSIFPGHSRPYVGAQVWPMKQALTCAAKLERTLGRMRPNLFVQTFFKLGFRLKKVIPGLEIQPELSLHPKEPP